MTFQNMGTSSMSFPSPPSLVRSLSDDRMMMDVSPAFSSPMRSVQNYVPHSQPHAGLGISHCDMGPSGEQPRVYTSESYPSPTTDWSDQIMPPDSILDAAMDVGPFSPATHYEQFGGYPDVSASPLSFYSSQTLSASPEYGVPMEISGHHDIMRSQSSGMWTNVNHSDGQCKIKEEPNDFWDPSLFPITNAPSTPVVAPMPQLMGNNTAITHPQQAGSTNGTLVELDPSVDHLSDQGQRSVVQSHPYEIPSASGLECTTCGTRFTRRSNCREHMKKHDPSRRKMYQCETCERRFGRRTDLRRHVDSIHRGIRKFSCDVCDSKFSRQDTLTRHRADCERRKRRAAKGAKREATDDAPPSPTTVASPEIKMEPFSPEM